MNLLLIPNQTPISCVTCKDEIGLVFYFMDHAKLETGHRVNFITFFFFFSLIDQAIKMLLKCQVDAGTFLSPEHLLMGEMEDHLAQVYATLGMALSSHYPMFPEL